MSRPNIQPRSPSLPWKIGKLWLTFPWLFYQFSEAQTFVAGSKVLGGKGAPGAEGEPSESFHQMAGKCWETCLTSQPISTTERREYLSRRISEEESWKILKNQWAGNDGSQPIRCCSLWCLTYSIKKAGKNHKQGLNPALTQTPILLAEIVKTQACGHGQWKLSSYRRKLLGLLALNRYSTLSA